MSCEYLLRICCTSLISPPCAPSLLPRRRTGTAAMTIQPRWPAGRYLRGKILLINGGTDSLCHRSILFFLCVLLHLLPLITTWWWLWRRAGNQRTNTRGTTGGRGIGTEGRMGREKEKEKERYQSNSSKIPFNNQIMSVEYGPACKGLLFWTTETSLVFHSSQHALILHPACVRLYT